jgi:hypothetical protein
MMHLQQHTSETKMKATAPLSICFLFLSVCTSSVFAQSSYLQTVGNAYELGSGKLLYSETHQIRREANKIAERVVVYRCANGTPFARKQLSYDNGVLVPTFETNDARTGYREGLRKVASTHEVFFQRDSKRKEEKEKLDKSANLVADAGFDEFVVQNWDRLLKKESVALDFVVPSQLDFLRFKVKWTGTAQFEGENVQMFKLAPSGVLGWITSGLDVGYADKDRSLRNFSGITNLRDNDGDNYEAKITFSRKAEGAASAESLQAAKALLLKNRCN